MDWESIEREYRASQLSVKEIARRNGCSRAAIQKKAKQKGWTRDLSDQVRREVAVKVAAGATPNPASSTITDEEIIDAASVRGAAAIEGHLARANRLKRIADRIAEGLERHMGITESQAVDLEGMPLPNDPGFALFVAKSDGPASILKCLADVTERIARLERTALNLDDAPPASETELLIEID